MIKSGVRKAEGEEIRSSPLEKPKPDSRMHSLCLSLLGDRPGDGEKGEEGSLWGSGAQSFFFSDDDDESEEKDEDAGE